MSDPRSHLNVLRQAPLAHSGSTASSAKEFLDNLAEFSFGTLPTEQPHPGTRGLAELCRSDLSEAIRRFQTVEIEALQAVVANPEQIETLGRDIRQTLSAGHRVFISGCGSTGRLAIQMESLWRKQNANTTSQDSVIGFIAGGDFALVKTIENFEDRPDYGAQQLQDLGFGPHDLLIACTEGGETPFVIGTVVEAAMRSTRQPYFLYCNPGQILMQSFTRSREVIENDRIFKICIETGPMALAGSTRLQATSALMLTLGLALFTAEAALDQVGKLARDYVAFIKKQDLSKLAPLIEAEADIYLKGGRINFEAPQDAVTVLSDLTERSPTFSLGAIENRFDPAQPAAWATLMVRDAKTSEEAWEHILGRAPRALTWPEHEELYGLTVLRGFDFSRPSIALRNQKYPESLTFQITRGKGTVKPSIQLKLASESARLSAPSHPLLQMLHLKLLLNLSSTLCMGICGRFQSNIMTYVRPTNKKLIDRSTRCVLELAHQSGLTQLTYETVVEELFALKSTLPAQEPIVLKTLESLKAKHEASAQGTSITSTSANSRAA